MNLGEISFPCSILILLFLALLNFFAGWGIEIIFKFSSVSPVHKKQNGVHSDLIGRTERSVIFLFILAGFPQIIPIVLTFKAFTRAPLLTIPDSARKFEGQRKRLIASGEMVYVGSLLSLLIASSLGFLARYFVVKTGHFPFFVETLFSSI